MHAENDEYFTEDREYPVLALRDMVVFPENSASLFIGRSISLQAAQAAYQFGTPLVLLTQKNAATEQPKEEDLYQIGTLATIRRYVVMPHGTLNLAVHGIRRIKLKKLNMFEKYYSPFPELEDVLLKKNKTDKIMINIKFFWIKISVIFNIIFWF